VEDFVLDHAGALRTLADRLEGVAEARLPTSSSHSGSTLRRPADCSTSTPDNSSDRASAYFWMCGDAVSPRTRPLPQEFLCFLNAVEAAVPVDKVVHVILDDYATHKHPKVRSLLEKHPWWVFHFTPTSASWLTAVRASSPS
jgi:hypothetical protein